MLWQLRSNLLNLALKTALQSMLHSQQQTFVEDGHKGIEYSEEIKDANGFLWETNADKREKKENSLW